MKVPTLFTIDIGIDEKIRQALEEMSGQNRKKEKDIKYPEEEKGRKIIVHSKDFPVEFNINDILVCVSYSRNKEGFFLDASSGDDFYLPVSDNPIDWSSRIKKKGTAFLKNEKNLMDYFRILKKENKGFFIWQYNDLLKEEFEWYISNKN